LVTHIYIFIIC